MFTEQWNSESQWPGYAENLLGRAVREAMSAPELRESERARLRTLTSNLVRRLRRSGMEPQTAILQVKEILHQSSRGIRVEQRHIEIWGDVIRWTISAYYRAD